MYLGLGTRIGSSRTSATIQITTPAYLDPAKMRVGDVIGSAFTAGVYPDFQGNPVVETSVAYTVDGGPVLASYVLQAGDVVGAALVHLTAGAAVRDYYAEPSDVYDLSFSTPDITFTVPAGSGSAPDQFAAGGWSVADDGTNGDATVTITTLPADNGSAITALEYQIDSGSWLDLGGTTTGTYAVSGFSDGTAAAVSVRAVNANGNGPASATKSVTTTGIPAAFTAGMWTLTDLATGGDARIAISALPSANGSALTDLERKVGAGAWTSLAGTTTGNYDVAGFTDGVATNVLIRAKNAKGNGPDSDTKSVTTSAAGSGIALVGVTTHNTGGIVNKTISLTSLTGGLDTQPSADDVVVVTFAGGSNTDRTLAATGYTQIAQQRPNDVYDVNHYCGYKVMGGTPDTSVDLTAASASSAHGGVVIVEVWRGVNTTTPMDVAAIPDTGTNSALANPPSITPVTAGARVCVSAAAAHVAGAFNLSSSDLGTITVINADATIDVSALRGSVVWSSGAFDPAALTFGAADSTDNSWAAVTFALRPA